MDELELQEKPGLFTRIAGVFVRDESYEDEDPALASAKGGRPLPVRAPYRYSVTVRRQIASFDDAMAAATGLKRGEQQILNLSGTDPILRQKIVDFMCGVNFAQEGTWEEIGESIYMIVPASAYVEVAPAEPRHNALRN